MLKTLFKKQFLVINTWLIQDKKKGTIRSKTVIALLILLYVFLFGIVGAMFFGVSNFLCSPLCSVGLDWLYFVMMSLMAITLGLFGSVFNTFATLYEAKDNELLLSMPIPPSYILLARILGVYFWSLIYTALIFIPALLVYLIFVKFSVSAIVCGILLLIAISVFVLAVSCVLGWVVAKISSKLKNKSFITVILAIIFMTIYYFFYFKANELLKEFLVNAVLIGSKIKGAILPLYWLGKAGTGDFLSLLLIIAIVGLIMAVIAFVLSRTFIKMATTSKAAAKRKYVDKSIASRSVDMALLSKELRRFSSSATYMLNCSLGCLFFPAIGIAAIIKADWVRNNISTLKLPNDILLMLLCAGICMIASMNDITAPSISLEGKHLWVLQSLPVSSWKVLKAKLNMHLILTEIPIIICTVALSIVIRLSFLSALVFIILPMIFVILNAAFGLFVNLLSPNLTWTNEVVPIKQSLSVAVSLFGGWIFVAALGALYFAVDSFISSYIYLLICGVIILIFSTVLLLWIKNKGSKIFSNL